MMKTMTGGCQCGRVRYEAEVEDDSAYLCHCKMCQHATGGFAAAFKNVKFDNVRFEQEPDWYASSPIAKRPFCSSCGTPLGFRYNEGSENIDLTVGSFDDPSALKPDSHFGVESMHEAWIDTSALKRHRSDEHPTLAQKWSDAGSKLPE